MKHSTLRQSFGIYILALWAFILAVESFIKLMYVSGVGVINLQVNAPLIPLTIYQGLNVLFSVGFVVAGVTLWRKVNWGRYLFIALATLYFGLSIIGSFSGEFANDSQQNPWALSVRYALSIILPAIYLFLPHISNLFKPNQKDGNV